MTAHDRPLHHRGPITDRLPFGQPIPMDLDRLAKHDSAVRYYLTQARLLRKRGLQLPAERVITPRTRPAASVAMSGMHVGEEGPPALSGLRILHNHRQWGETAAERASEPGCHTILEPTRRKEIAYVSGLEPGTLVLSCDSAKSQGGGRLSGLSLYVGSEPGDDGGLEVYCRPLLTFGARLSTERRPVRLRHTQSSFTGWFSSHPKVAPCTAVDLVALHEVLGWPEPVLHGKAEERVGALGEWAKKVDHDEVAARWATQAAHASAASPRRVVLGGAAAHSGRLGQLLAALAVGRLLPTARVEDVSGQCGAYDLAVLEWLRECLQIEVKATVARVADPVRWARQTGRFEISQEHAAERSLQRGQTPWIAAIVSDVLRTPTVTLLRVTDVFPHLAVRAGLDQEVA